MESGGIDRFTLKEMETVSAIKREYGTPGTIRVVREGGLPRGKHQVKLTVCTRTAALHLRVEGYSLYGKIKRNVVG